MTVCLLRIGDGRDDYHERSWESAKQHLTWDEVVTVDDRHHQLGFCGAIQHGWDQVIDTGCDYVLHLELDFTFHKTVPVGRMCEVLGRHPELAQLVLKRQAWNDQERAAGGIIEQHPGDYTERYENGDVWTEHRRFWSTNPCVYPARLCRLGWPQESESEGKFTHRLLRDPHLRFAFWGAKHDPPLVEHIGTTRHGNGY